MEAQSQTQSQPTFPKSVRCAMCENEATTQRFVEEAGGLLCVCSNCNLMLAHTDRLSSLEAEFKQHIEGK